MIDPQSSWSSVALVAICLVLLPSTASPQSAADQPADQAAQNLKRLTLDELTEIDVTSVSRRVERLSETAAAIAVIRREDIRRSGATTLAEALRLADGLHVAQVYGAGWAISARGFNISTANKLLVLIDGRTVYSPLFSGVFWDVQDLVLNDIDRIEVIRGPGGTLWGANAVNGVINIITRSSAETAGGYATVSAGDPTPAIASGRYGGRIGAAATYRVYGKFRATGAGTFVTGQSADDEYQQGQSGFRIDSNESAPARWTLQGDVYRASAGLFDRPDTKLSGGNVLGRWSRRSSDDAETRIQIYYDHTYRRVERQYKATRDTFDVDTQQQLRLASRHALVLGAGFRASRGDDLGDGPGFFFDPQIRTSTLFSVFAQDEIAVVPERLFVIAGSKFEKNDFTGFEIQPNVRVRWTSDPRQTLWGAVSRAVRMPTRFDTDLRIRVPGSSALFLTGNEDFASENVIAYEVGYRLRPSARVAFDVSTYANRYDDLRSQEAPAAPGQPFVLANTLNARTSGVEVGSTVTPADWWQIHASYGHLHQIFTKDPGSRDVTGGTSEANDPSNLAALRSLIDLPRGVQVDAFLRYAGALPNPAVPAYTELDLHVGWRFRPDWDVSLVGQNLLHDRHVEFGAATPREAYERGGYVRVTWRP